MRTESNIKPTKFIIEHIKNEKVIVSFFDNIQEQEDMFYYDMYKMILNNRPNLAEDIENNYDTWLQFAKDLEYEKLAKEVRLKRDELLNETDWTQVTDTVLSLVKQEEYKVYRQQLRDITKQEGFPYKVSFPLEPSKHGNMNNNKGG